MSARHSALGALSVLAFGSPALAGDMPQAATVHPPYRLSYETTKAAGGYEVKIYAQNQSDAVVMIDDNPFVSEALLATKAGEPERLNSGFDADMMSRAGPRRRWMAVQPGERLLVGTTQLTVPEGGVLDGTELTLHVRVVTKDRTDEVVDTVPLAPPAT